MGGPITAQRLRAKITLGTLVQMVTTTKWIQRVGAPKRAAMWIRALATRTISPKALGSKAHQAQYSTIRMPNAEQPTPSPQRNARGRQIKLLAMEQVVASGTLIRCRPGRYRARG